MSDLQLYSGPIDRMASTTADLDFVQATVYPPALDFFVGYVKMSKLLLDYGSPPRSLHTETYDVVISSTPIGVAIQRQYVPAVCTQLAITLKAGVVHDPSTNRISVGQLLIAADDLCNVLVNAGVERCLVTMIGTRRPLCGSISPLAHVTWGMPVTLDIGYSYNLEGQGDTLSCFVIKQRGAVGRVDGSPFGNDARKGHFTKDLNWENYPMYTSYGKFKNGGFKFFVVR